MEQAGQFSITIGQNQTMYQETKAHYIEIFYILVRD
jgi:hypothetical protein